MRGKIVRYDDSWTAITTLTMAARSVADALKSEERFYCGKTSGYVTVRECGSTRVLEPPHGLEPWPFTWRHNESVADARPQ